MNISFQPLSVILGSVTGVLAFFTLKNPVVSLMTATFTATVTEVILRLQNQE